MTVNAAGAYDPVTHRVVRTTPRIAGLPGAVDGTVAGASARESTTALLLLFLSAELARDRKWFRRLWLTPVLIGPVVAGYGLLSYTPADTIMSVRHKLPGAGFGPFAYHGHAGTFLNLCLPACLTVVFLTWRRRGNALAKALALVGAALVLCGVVVNNSRAAQLIGAVIGLVVTFRLLAPAAGGRVGAADQVPGGPRLLVRMAGAAVLALLVAGTALATTWQKWSMLPDQLTRGSPRLVMWRVGLHLLESAGPLGTGPGTYKVLYPLAPQELLRDLYPVWVARPYIPSEPASLWSHAHNDYLQTAVEWGWVGAAAWLVILWGGTARALAGPGAPATLGEDLARRWAVGIALLGLCAHATVDIPMQLLSLQAYLAVYLGLAWGRRKTPPNPPTPPQVQGVERPVLRVAARVVATRPAERETPRAC
ncbi:MAG: O-antigen ligase family protein [Phycisphaerae bacterium]